MRRRKTSLLDSVVDLSNMQLESVQANVTARRRFRRHLPTNRGVAIRDWLHLLLLSSSSPPPPPQLTTEGSMTTTADRRMRRRLLQQEALQWSRTGDALKTVGATCIHPSLGVFFFCHYANMLEVQIMRELLTLLCNKNERTCSCHS